MLSRPYDLVPRAHPIVAGVYKTCLTLVTFVSVFLIIPRLLQLAIPYELGFFLASLFMASVSLGIVHGIELLKPQLYPPKFLWDIANTMIWVLIELVAVSAVTASLFRIYSAFQENMFVDMFAFAMVHFMLMGDV